jgi:hypothetical protein
MNGRINITESEQELARLARGRREVLDETVLRSSGATVSCLACVIEGNLSYNFYKVRAVEVGQAGSLPVEIGEQMQAVNLAESFLAQGQLANGIFVIIHRVGDKNVFYAKP